MARTFISQPNQIFKTEEYSDVEPAGVGLQDNSTNLESDLNAIRSQIRRLLWAGVSGSWYDAITSPSGSNSARGLNTINTDLTDLEQKRFLFRNQNLNLVNVATGSNFAFLSVSLGTAPANHAVVSHPLSSSTFATGSIVALLSGSEGSYGTHSMAQTSGSSVLTPKNLVVVRDFWTGMRITGSSGRDVYGLLQIESGASGQSFNDTNRRTQISFVIEQISNSTSSLVPVSAGLIGGKSISYSYVKRVALDDIPEDAYLSDTIFIDFNDGGSAGSGNANLSDITLDRAIDNQSGIASQDQNIDIRMLAGTHWAYLSGTKELWRLDSSDTADVLTVAVDRFAISSSVPSTFQLGATFASGSTPINVGLAAGTIATLSASNLILSGGAQLGLSDIFGPTSTYGGFIPLATSTLQWNNFFTGFGQQSILGAFTFLSQSLSGTVKRVRYNAGVIAGVNPNTNITFPTNLDAPLGSYLGRDFKRDVNIYLNGVLMLPGDAIENNDVYPGTSPAAGDLRFAADLRSGTLLTMEIFG